MPKKWVVLGLAVGLALTLVACGTVSTKAGTSMAGTTLPRPGSTTDGIAVTRSTPSQPELPEVFTTSVVLLEPILALTSKLTLVHIRELC